MPKKSIREMNILERIHYSLGTRIFHMVLVLSLIISAAAIMFGLFLYVTSVNREYRNKTWTLSRTAAHTLDTQKIMSAASKVLPVYDGMTEEERLLNETEEYMEKFSFVMDDASFSSIRRDINYLTVTNDAVAGYAAALDTENNRMIFLVDGDPKSTFCPPGYWDELEEEQITAFLKGAKVSKIDQMINGTESIPSIVSNMERYGYRCTAGTLLFYYNNYPVYIFYDTDMNLVAKAGKSFLWQYIAMLAVIAVLAAFFVNRYIKRTVVKPINKLAEAAETYSKDKKDQHGLGRHFEKLNIHTGDEIENLSLCMKDMEHDMGEYVSDLTRVTAEKERISTELDVASQIQEGMLPHIFPAFPERPEFDVYASMSPAKEVGGDFYDFFLIDEDHLALVMADVSGKGIPAALFMMASKILINNFSLMDKTSPARILSEVNRQICKSNTMEMFVTVWLGILEISTGRLKAANAGHEYPVLRRKDGKYTLLKDKHGFVLGGFDGISYTEYDMNLAPGDSVFQYTDGVTEATRDSGELFGTDRLVEALNWEADAAPEKILENVANAVDDFVSGAEQFDDITMLCLTYHGPEDRK